MSTQSSSHKRKIALWKLPGSGKLPPLLVTFVAALIALIGIVSGIIQIIQYRQPLVIILALVLLAVAIALVKEFWRLRE